MGIKNKAACTFHHMTARMTMLCPAACCGVLAVAPGPSSFNNGANVSGPRVDAEHDLIPKSGTCFAMV